MLRDNKIYKFYQQVKQEASRVVWPDRKELTTSTIVVVIAVLIFSVIFLVLDYGIHNIVQLLLQIGK